MGLFSKDKEPQQVNVKGSRLTCTVCGHNIFKPRKAQLNTKVASLMNLDWANKSAFCYICANCSHMEWFMEEQ
jgi:DNA-directed RNA polymerase subunit RPC12/RpoP